MANVEHNALTGSSLHNSKATSFTGDPSAFTPGESGVFYVRTDVTPRKLFMSTGTTAGALTEVGSATAGAAATVSVGTVTTTTLAGCRRQCTLDGLEDNFLVDAFLIRYRVHDHQYLFTVHSRNLQTPLIRACYHIYGHRDGGHFFARQGSASAV